MTQLYERSSLVGKLGYSRNVHQGVELKGAGRAFDRWSGFVAVAGGTLCVVLSPVQSYIWNGEASPGWVLVMRPLLDVVLNSAPTAPYDFYGRTFFLVYLSIFPMLFTLHVAQRSPVRRLERAGFSLTLAGLGLALLGDIGAYWGGLGHSDSGFTSLQRTAFGVEGVGVLFLAVGATMFGIATLRGRVVAQWVAWALILAIPAGFPMAWLIRYVPHGIVLPYSMTWAAIGWLYWSGRLQITGRLPSAQQTAT